MLLLPYCLDKISLGLVALSGPSKARASGGPGVFHCTGPQSAIDLTSNKTFAGPGPPAPPLDGPEHCLVRTNGLKTATALAVSCRFNLPNLAF